MSSTILGYPIPSIVNWGAKGDDRGDGGRRARQMEKIYAVADYLDNLEDVKANDLVLLTDSLDTWFQLPPSILVQRYHTINARANQLLKAKLGPSAKYASQAVVFSAEKKCWPRSAEDMGCGGLPESPLPKDIYGPLTDVNNYHVPDYVEFLHGKKHQEGEAKVTEGQYFSHMRSRYLNSGFMLSPVSQARELFHRAAVIARADPQVYGADQGIFAQLLGEQTYVRDSRQSAEQSPWKRGKIVDFNPVEGQQYEWGIGLDYERSLGYPTAFAEQDFAWIKFQDMDDIEAKARELNVTNPRVITQGLQQDIGKAPTPLSDIPGQESTTWASLPLFTDLWTGITPATIHHNALTKGRKKIRDESWWRMWFVPWTRQLFDAQKARFEDEESSHRFFMSKGRNSDLRGVVRDEMVRENGFGAETVDREGKKGWIRWDEICDENSQRDVFEAKQPEA